MSKQIDRLTIRGFKSIRQLDDFPLRQLNVLIGANGSGKSNFLSFFTMLHELIEDRLQLWVNAHGGADTQLYLGPKITKELVGKLEFGATGYHFHLEPTVDNRLIFRDERIVFPEASDPSHAVDRSFGVGHSEALLDKQLDEALDISAAIHDTMIGWLAYHFHDTSETAGIRRHGSVHDNEYLRGDASNLAAVIYRLRQEHPIVYARVRQYVRVAAPFFDDFKLRPQQANGDETIRLEWRQTGSDYPLQPAHFSDGTLRFIALVTALMQPDPPATILLDEPELGLHPHAVEALGDLIIQAAEQTQLIVSTQSTALLNAFEPEDIIVVDREHGESRFRRLEREALSAWLAEDYTLGELWWKNVFGGLPHHE